MEGSRSKTGGKIGNDPATGSWGATKIAPPGQQCTAARMNLPPFVGESFQHRDDWWHQRKSQEPHYGIQKSYHIRH